MDQGHQDKPGVCPVCSGSRFWLSRTGRSICAHCYPDPLTALQVLADQIKATLTTASAMSPPGRRNSSHTATVIPSAAVLASLSGCHENRRAEGPEGEVVAREDGLQLTSERHPVRRSTNRPSRDDRCGEGNPDTNGHPDERRTAMPPLQPTGDEPILVPCPHCGAEQLYFAAVEVHPAEGGMDVHISLTEGQAHEYPTNGPELVPIIAMHLQCLTCDGWPFLGLASGINDGTWLKFHGYMPEPHQQGP